MQTIEVKKEKRILTVHLNRPDLHNAFNPMMIKELTDVFLKEAKKYRMVILRGNGKSFCAGADLNWMQSMIKFTKAQNKQDSLKLFNMFQAIQKCEVPVIAQVHGNVFAGGLGLIAAADIVLAEENTKFCFSEPKLGLVPAVISNFVATKMNPSILREVFLTAEVFLTDKALKSGLVHFAGTHTDCEVQMQWKIEALLKCGPEAIKKTKKLLNSIPGTSPSKLKILTTHLISEVRVSKEGQEGLKSFLEKRNPSWIDA